MLTHKKYKNRNKFNFKNRTWPDRNIKKAPCWCSVDLRDGNQALPAPMDIEKKTEFFKMLVKTGFKEIEVSYPSSSGMEFDFTRRIIEQNIIPADVSIQVLTPARKAFIDRTFAALKGARQAIIHLYLPTSQIQRKFVFGKSKQQILKTAVDSASYISGKMKEMPETRWSLQFTPESFSATEQEYAFNVCSAVRNSWRVQHAERYIINLPSTVEINSPNIYADRIEWFSGKIKSWKDTIISVHCHNDRGTAIAAAEFGLMAGAKRAEGTLFGNGERTGNADIITLALNLYSQGIDPKLDFSRLSLLSEQYKNLTGMDVYSRQPYSGQLVFTAFSGGHQDAIAKGIRAWKEGKMKKWDVPYLPVDPEDLGYDHSGLIRVNSQSGSGALVFILENQLKKRIVKSEIIRVAEKVQKLAENNEGVIPEQEIIRLFLQDKK
ncbi:MAG: 2-isopropylmalate synthase [Spirochaetes bacterium GWF1_41_5]|nr:MAG: 2-isopropylmalate synthase [Spirochaetes bacterium GWF1_41_5]HBE02199.1 2-isopropylmalate synthase [Spirochaetia bacterium]